MSDQHEQSSYIHLLRSDQIDACFFQVPQDFFWRWCGQREDMSKDDLRQLKPMLEKSVKYWNIMMKPGEITSRCPGRKQKERIKGHLIKRCTWGRSKSGCRQRIHSDESWQELGGLGNISMVHWQVNFCWCLPPVMSTLNQDLSVLVHYLAPCHLGFGHYSLVSCIYSSIKWEFLQLWKFQTYLKVHLNQILCNQYIDLN